MPPDSHHRPDGFQNNYIEFKPRSLGEVLKWKLDAWRADLPKPPSSPTPHVPPDLGFIRANATAGVGMKPAITWVGHATMLAQFAGLNIITDPVFSDRVSPFSFVGPKRVVAPGLTLADLPHIDVVLISHNHYDHLDDASIRALAGQAGGPPLFIVPLGIKAWMEKRVDARVEKTSAATVVELDWWKSQQVQGANGKVDIFLTPSQHWSGRGLTDRLDTLWGGYAVFASDFSFFFAGDTAYSKDFADIHSHFASMPGRDEFDIALIPIGAYEPRWFMSTQHVNPDEAVRIAQDIHARQSVGVHWGTFQLTDEPSDQPPRDLAAARAAHGMDDDAFVVMAIGETRKLRPRTP